jgi:uncharacterized coiled-coil DUF342 family protein
MASDDKKKLEELRSAVNDLKKERDDLNTNLRSKRDSIMGLYGEIDKLLKDAKKKRDSRDEANKKVSVSKKERDAANKKIADLNKKLGEARGQVGGTMSQRDYEKLKKEYDSLNWKMQTSPVSKDRETAMIKRLEELEAQVKEYEILKPAEKDASKIERELKTVRQRADSYHKKLLEASEDGEAAHAQMHEIYKKVDAKREKAKKAEEEFLEIKTKASQSHDKFVEKLNELRAEEDRQGIKRTQEKKAEMGKLKKEQKAKESDLLSELRKGGVIKTGDLLFLQDLEDKK